VTAARTAQAAIWSVVADAAAELDRLVTDERAATTALVDQAIAGDDIAKGRQRPRPTQPVCPTCATTSTYCSRPAPTATIG
jgi:hypothetical protein